MLLITHALMVFDAIVRASHFVYTVRPVLRTDVSTQRLYGFLFFACLTFVTRVAYGRDTPYTPRT